METKSAVLVVDDDRQAREAIGALLRSVGLEPKTLASVPEFLAYKRPDVPCCLILDVRLPGKSGLHLQSELRAARDFIPTVFVTAHGDVPMSVEAMKRGAVDFLLKPFRDQDLIDAVEVGLARDLLRRQQEKDFSDLRDRCGSLSARARQILAQVLRGRLNKQIATDLGITEATVKVHRAQIARKMKASSLAELVLMAAKLRQSGDLE